MVSIYTYSKGTVEQTVGAHSCNRGSGGNTATVGNTATPSGGESMKCEV